LDRQGEGDEELHGCLARELVCLRDGKVVANARMSILQAVGHEWGEEMPLEVEVELSRVVQPRGRGTL